MGGLFVRKIMQFILPVFCVSLVVSISSCELSGDSSSENESPRAEASYEPVRRIWVKITIDSHVLQEMFARDEDGTVMQNFTDYYEENEESEGAVGFDSFNGVEVLLASDVIVEDDGGYRVEVDPDEWNIGQGEEFGETEVVQAMRHALEANDVDWCGEPMKGYEFADAYVDSYWGSFDTQEQYLASIGDYVDCGSGDL
jgi:hypothetical protein